MKDSRSARPPQQEPATQPVAGHQRENERSAPAPRVTRPEFYSDVDDASEASFPASDPPAWMGVPPGGPERR